MRVTPPRNENRTIRRLSEPNAGLHQMTCSSTCRQRRADPFSMRGCSGAGVAGWSDGRRGAAGPGAPLAGPRNHVLAVQGRRRLQHRAGESSIPRGVLSRSSLVGGFMGRKVRAKDFDDNLLTLRTQNLGRPGGSTRWRSYDGPRLPSSSPSGQYTGSAH